MLGFLVALLFTVCVERNIANAAEAEADLSAPSTIVVPETIRNKYRLNTIVLDFDGERVFVRWSVGHMDTGTFVKDTQNTYYIRNQTMVDGETGETVPDPAAQDWTTVRGSAQMASLLTTVKAFMVTKGEL